MASPLVAARPRRVGKNRADIGSNDTAAALIDQHAWCDCDEAIAAALGASLADSRSAETPLSWGFRVGAGEGNRTLITSLEGCAYHIAAQAIPRSACMAIARE